MTHKLPDRYRNDAVTIAVIGAGGNGSHMLHGLARLSITLEALGHPGIKLKIWDGDIVSETNVGRQLFSPSDVGANKAVLLATRINAFYGLDVEAMPFHYKGNNYSTRALFVGCVDGPEGRKAIADTIGQDEYWLDLGNDDTSGQFVLGQGQFRKDQKRDERLPNAADLFPDLIDTKKKVVAKPSCNLAIALGAQDLFINQAVATHALHLLWTWFRTGEIHNHGGWVNLRTGRVTPINCDPALWLRMGYSNQELPLRKIVRWYQRPAMMRPGRAKLECGHIMWTQATQRTRCDQCKTTS